MRLVYFDDGAELATKYARHRVRRGRQGRTATASTSTRTAATGPDLVKVSLQKQTATSGWTTVESSYFDPDFTTDKIKLTADGIDLGDDSSGRRRSTRLGDGVLGPGEDGAITPRVDGSLYLNNMAGVCARMKIYYWSADEELSRRSTARRVLTRRTASTRGPSTSRRSRRPGSTTSAWRWRPKGTNGSWNQVDNSAHAASDGAFLDAND